MKRVWPKVRLEEVLKPVARVEVPIPGKIYRQIGVRLWGEGVYERESIDGGETRYKELFRTEADDIIVNKIWARNGSVAVVPQSLAGCYGSGEFPMFSPMKNRLDPRWIHWISKTRDFWAQCDEKSQGTSGKNRIKPERFLDIIIPLPTIAEQRRIVAWIEEFATQILQLRHLRREVINEIDLLAKAGGFYQFTRAQSKFSSERLAEITTRITKGESPEWQGFAYQDDGPIFIRSENVLWGKLDAKNATHIPEEFNRKLMRSQICAGDVLINLVGASIGRVCIVPDSLGKANINQAVAVITPQSEILLSTYLQHYLLYPLTQDIIHAGKVETARPNISLSDLRNLSIPVPPVSEQKLIVSELDAFQMEIEKLKSIQRENSSDMDTLLPIIFDMTF